MIETREIILIIISIIVFHCKANPYKMALKPYILLLCLLPLTLCLIDPINEVLFFLTTGLLRMATNHRPLNALTTLNLPNLPTGQRLGHQLLDNLLKIDLIKDQQDLTAVPEQGALLQGGV